MSGLRSQWEYTITCVSLRSGIASSGTVLTDHTPAMTAAVTVMKTSRRLRAEKSMMALITAVSCVRRRRRRRAVLMLGRRGAHPACCRLQLALRMDQERAGGDHVLAS